MDYISDKDYQQVIAMFGMARGLFKRLYRPVTGTKEEAMDLIQVMLSDVTEQLTVLLKDYERELMFNPAEYIMEELYDETVEQILEDLNM